MKYWLVKQEPGAYSWAKFQREGRTSWTGVRNFQARNHLRAMSQGDLVLFYHSVTGKQVMGVARVEKPAFPDPTAKEGEWYAVELAPVETLETPVTLEAIKADKSLAGLPLLKQSRLSVMPVTPAQFKRIMKLARAS